MNLREMAMHWCGFSTEPIADYSLQRLNELETLLREVEQAAFKMAIEVASESHYLGVAIIRIGDLAKERAK